MKKILLVQTPYSKEIAKRMLKDRGKEFFRTFVEEHITDFKPKSAKQKTINKQEYRKS